MRRALLALAVYLTVTSSPALAGYLILRVLTEGGTPPSNTDPNGVGVEGDPDRRNRFPQPPAPINPVRPVPAPPGRPVPGTTTPTPKDKEKEVDHSRGVVVVIPIEDELAWKRIDSKAKFFKPEDNLYYRRVVVPFHKEKLHASLFVDSSTIQLYDQLITKPGARRTRKTDVHEQYDLWNRSKKDVRLLYDALVLALEAGIINDPTLDRDGKPSPDAMKIAQELLDVAAEKKLTMPDPAQEFVNAWSKVSGQVKETLRPTPEVETWKQQIDATMSQVIGHYAIIYWDRETSGAEITRRAGQLNDNFAAFFLVQAIRGNLVKVPDKPLIVVIAKQGFQKNKGTFSQLYVALDGIPRAPNPYYAADAFYSPDHNLVVLSSTPLDDVAQSFLRQNQQVFNKGLSRSKLLANDIPKLDHTGEKGIKPDDVARANTLALVEKLMLEEVEIATISFEATRQLLFSSEALPRHVTLPNWLMQGALNTYTRPRGPAYVSIGDDEKPHMTVAYATGYGGPNYVLQRYFNEMRERKELNPDSVAMLENILKDAYFTAEKDGLDPDPAPPTKKKKDTTGTPVVPLPKQPPFGAPMGIPPIGIPGGIDPEMRGGATVITDVEDPAITLRKKRTRASIKANATAWALYYYLARAEPRKLRAYIDELNKFPRDLTIDGKSAHEAFVRVFDLAAKPGGPADPERMKRFTKTWMEYITTVPNAGIDIPLVAAEPPKTNPTPVGQPKLPPGRIDD